MRTLNKVFLVAHLGRDAETKYTPSGVACTTFSVATNRRVKDGEEWRDEVEWHNCVMWRAEATAPHLLKGKPVHIEGHLQTRSWEGKSGEKRYSTEVVVEELILLGAKPQDEAGGPALVSAPRGAVAAKKAADPLEITDDDVPF